jgi:hypothetical protein
MITPSRIGKVDASVSLLLEELTEDTETSCSRDGLNASHVLLFVRYDVFSVEKFDRLIDELWIATDCSVLLIHLGFVNDLLSLADTVEDVRFAFIVTVRADAKVDLERITILLE